MRDFLELWASPPPMRRHEQRGDLRHQATGAAELWPEGVETTRASGVTARVRDVSAHGLGFVCPDPLPAGSRWRARLNDGQRELAQQSVTVRHCRKLGAREYLVGCQLSLSDALLAGLSAPAAG